MKFTNAIEMTNRCIRAHRFIGPHLLLIPFFFAFSAGIVCGQARRENTHSPEDDGPQLVEEMKARWEIKYAEKERLENLDQAREASQLAAELHSTFMRINILGSTEKKKLDRLEKVTRKIRSRAGGSDGDVTLTDMPGQVGPMLKRLADTAEELNKAVEKTPRQIVSATVIERSNEVLEMIRLVRSLTR